MFYLHVYVLSKGVIEILWKISSQLDFNNKPTLAKKFSWISTWINYLVNIYKIWLLVCYQFIHCCQFYITSKMKT